MRGIFVYMTYCIDPNVEEPIMLINEHIGFDEDEGQGVDGSLFQRELLELDGLGKKRIQVWINSPGGVVMDGYNIYNAILKSKTKVDTYCVGIAASIAAVIFQAGRIRYMADYGKLMYHNPYGGNSKELDVMKDSIAVMIASRTGKSKEEILKIMDKTTWIGASEAFMNGFCDTVEPSSDHNRKRVSSSEPKMMWKESSEVLNSILSNQNKKTMFSKVTNKLGLVESANEDAILEAIAKIENKAEDAANELKKMEDALNAKKAEAEAAEAKAKNMVEGYAKQGRIKNEAIGKWVNLAKTDFEGTEEMLKELPVFKASNKIEINSVSNDAELTGVIAKSMRDVRNKVLGQ